MLGPSAALALEAKANAELEAARAHAASLPSLLAHAETVYTATVSGVRVNTARQSDATITAEAAAVRRRHDTEPVMVLGDDPSNAAALLLGCALATSTRLTTWRELHRPLSDTITLRREPLFKIRKADEAGAAAAPEGGAAATAAKREEAEVEHVCVHMERTCRELVAGAEVLTCVHGMVGRVIGSAASQEEEEEAAAREAELETEADRLDDELATRREMEAKMAVRREIEAEMAARMQLEAERTSHVSQSHPPPQPSQTPAATTAMAAAEKAAVAETVAAAADMAAAAHHVAAAADADADAQAQPDLDGVVNALVQSAVESAVDMIVSATAKAEEEAVKAEEEAATAARLEAAAQAQAAARAAAEAAAAEEEAAAEAARVALEAQLVTAETDLLAALESNGYGHLAPLVLALLGGAIDQLAEQCGATGGQRPREAARLEAIKAYTAAYREGREELRALQANVNSAFGTVDALRSREIEIKAIKPPSPDEVRRRRAEEGRWTVLLTAQRHHLEDLRRSLASKQATQAEIERRYREERDAWQRKLARLLTEHREALEQLHELRESDFALLAESLRAHLAPKVALPPPLHGHPNVTRRAIAAATLPASAAGGGDAAADAAAGADGALGAATSAAVAPSDAPAVLGASALLGSRQPLELLAEALFVLLPSLTHDRGSEGRYASTREDGLGDDDDRGDGGDGGGGHEACSDEARSAAPPMPFLTQSHVLHSMCGFSFADGPVVSRPSDETADGDGDGNIDTSDSSDFEFAAGLSHDPLARPLSPSCLAFTDRPVTAYASTRSRHMHACACMHTWRDMA